MSNHDHGPPFWSSMNTISGNHDVTPYRTPTDSRYALSGKIMLAAIFVLFVVVVFMLFLHIYARWYLFRSRRRRRTHLVFYVDPTNSLPLSSSGLDPSVLKSLPTFTFSSKPAGAGDDESIVPECAVCLSEFEDGETGRRLPKCDHSFHVDCIDMWFHSHSTCPLCRTAVDGDLPAGVEDNEVELTQSRQNESTQREARSSSVLNADCPPGPSTSSSFGGRSKAMDIVGVSVEVPARSASFSFGNSEDLGASSPAGQGLKSPTSRLLSLKRILSREKRPSSPASAIGTSGSELAEMEEGHVETRPHTPR